MTHSEKTLGVALVGVGGIARKYRSVYTRIPGVVVKAVVDPQEAELEAARRELSAARASDELAAALEDDVDVVVISTPKSPSSRPGDRGAGERQARADAETAGTHHR